ncbi:MAG: site-2 protease family protein [Bacteroidia bacterium]|nr:site-2 protease family protein [Bacteroidia bacterium]
MKGTLNIARVAGIPVKIHWTFLLLIAYIFFSNYLSGKASDQIIWTLLFILSIFLTVFLHELGHAAMARVFGIRTHDITILPIGGVARLSEIPTKPFEEILVSLAGPMVNVILSIVVYILYDIRWDKIILIKAGESISGENFFIYYFFVNLWLAVFNLIPGFPMDGGRVLRALLSYRMERYKATRIAAYIGQAIAVVFIFFGFFSNPFLIFIGLFIILGAESEAEFTRSDYLLSRVPVKSIVMKNYGMLQITDPISVAVEKILESENKNFVVFDNNRPVGTLSREDIIFGLEKFGKDITVESVTEKNPFKITHNMKLNEVYKNFHQGAQGYILVYDEHGHFEGVLDLENILEYMAFKNVLHS